MVRNPATRSAVCRDYGLIRCGCHQVKEWATKSWTRFGSDRRMASSILLVINDVCTVSASPGQETWMYPRRYVEERIADSACKSNSRATPSTDTAKHGYK